MIEEAKYTKALERLKYHTCFDCDFCSDTLFDCNNKQCDLKDAVKVAIDSLEKQIPKKPLHSGLDYDCPSCLETVGYITLRNKLIKNHHCKCGQKIDWSDYDE